MNRHLFLRAAAGAALVLLAGCAGPKYAALASSMPAVPAGQGRIYFYQPEPATVVSAQHVLRVNDVAVGRNKPSSFFFVDRPAGDYSVTMQNSRNQSISFHLGAGETRYVRVMAENLGSTGQTGKVQMELADPPELAQRELLDMRYWGAASPEQRRWW
ncbi:DUF2846 domain-containing protein [Bordetella genomosp. 13]|uniref:DUF2846 domain-containing protein n=1 Tax=Bordetella genomosp. 13 TaxID=463040 RepID=UPI0011A4756E|nr:DUF2846 domain-containing protein [Bordetella genomosp. 13]